MTTMTMTDFLKFLVRHCADKQIPDDPGASIYSDQRAANEAYKDIAQFIKIFQQDYAEEKKLSQRSKEDALFAIASDTRRQFDDPVELLRHIQDLASSAPFINGAEVQLAAIQAFCNDYLSTHNAQVKQELRLNAPF